MTELEQLAESLACAVLDGDHGAASQLAQTYRARARRGRHKVSECRICKEPIEPCAKGWHEDVCHYHSLIVGDYLCGSWLQESIAREARALGEQAGSEAGDE